MVFSSVSVNVNTPQFSGYRALQPIANQAPNLAEVFLPGHEGQTVALQLEKERLPMSWDAKTGTWRSSAVPLGTAYRILVNDQFVPDTTYLNYHPDAKQQFNHIETLAQWQKTPQKTGPIAHVFRDCAVTQTRQNELLAAYQQGKGRSVGLPRTHNSSYGGNAAGLIELLPKLKQAGFVNVLLTPVSGGDTTTAHGYHTVDPYVFNNAFQNKTEFRQFIGELMKQDLKLFFDMALVDQGLNGLQSVQNLYHGVRSPFWDWLIFNEPQSAAQNKLKLGVLPVLRDAQTGKATVDWDGLALTLENNPLERNYNPKAFTYIQLDDARKHQADNTSNLFETFVQPYRFPVNANEVIQKLKKLSQQKLSLDSTEAKRELTQWENWQLTLPQHDDSGYKWDGQISIPKMNMNNPHVRQYMAGSMGYWARTVRNAYVANIIAQQPGLKPSNEAMAEAQRHKISEAQVPHILTDRLLTENSLLAVPLPPIAKGTFVNPAFQKALQQDPLPLPLKLLQWAASPVLLPLSTLLNKIPAAASLKTTLDQAVHPPSFQEDLEKRLEQHLSSLPKAQQEALQYTPGQRLAAERLADALWPLLVVGQTADTLQSPQDWEKAMLRLPKTLLHADPITGVDLWRQHLKQQLNRLTPDQWQQLVKNLLTPAETTHSIIAANALANQQEWGLNVRADALKDAVDIDALRSLPQSSKPAVFSAQMNQLKTLWNDMLAPIREVFPRALALGELTFFDGNLSGHHRLDLLEEKGQSLLETFNTLTNFDLANQYPRLVGENHLIWESSSQVKPSEFMTALHGKGLPISETGLGYWDRGYIQRMPWSSTRLLQNCADNQDWPTVAHGLLTNPNIARMDMNPYWGFAEDAQVALSELKDKGVFADWRKSFGNEASLKRALTALQEWLDTNPANSALYKTLPEPLQLFYSKASKEEASQKGKLNWRATPRDFKLALLDAAFENSSNPAKTLLSKPEYEALKLGLQQRLSEPSEVRAMRGVMNNLYEAHPDWFQNRHHDFVTAMEGAIKRYGEKWGYLPLEYVLDSVIDPLKLPQAEHCKKQSYAWLMTPVLEQARRVLSLQLGVPGQTTVYLQSLLGQTGGENEKDRANQIRNLVRWEWIDPKHPDYKPEVAQFVTDMESTLKLTHRLPAMHNGQLIPWPMTAQNKASLDTQGVVPFLKDDGQQQVLWLVNTGKPQAVSPTHLVDNPGGDPTRYPMLVSTQPTVQNLQIDVTELGLPLGARYQSDRSQQIYTVQETAQKRRLLLDNQGKGPNLTIADALIRL